MARSSNLIPEEVPNSHLRPLSSLIKLWKICPANFHRGDERVFASWRSGKPINPDRVLALLRMAVFEQGLSPTALSLNSMRAVGATALYRETGNVELVAGMGRW